jgi:hypothetical protein
VGLIVASGKGGRALFQSGHDDAARDSEILVALREKTRILTSLPHTYSILPSSELKEPNARLRVKCGHVEMQGSSNEMYNSKP